MLFCQHAYAETKPTHLEIDTKQKVTWAATSFLHLLTHLVASCQRDRHTCHRKTMYKVRGAVDGVYNPGESVLGKLRRRPPSLRGCLLTNWTCLGSTTVTILQAPVSQEQQYRHTVSGYLHRRTQVHAVFFPSFSFMHQVRGTSFDTEWPWATLAKSMFEKATPEGLRCSSRHVHVRSCRKV